MKRHILITALLLLAFRLGAQTNPAVTSWLLNTTGITGRHYVQGNPSPIQDNSPANVQSVQYSGNWVYVKSAGIPSYITGPFLDGNPSIAQPQTGYFKLPLQPVQNTGTPTGTTGGNIGIFINGVALFDYRDGVAWNTNTNSLCGGPGNPPCPGGPATAQSWNRDAILAERVGFDCAKGHPAMGNYHHHQNPSAFNLDLDVISNICDLYLADGLYSIDSTTHAPLIGYAYDGFPVYGAYGYKNADGTGGITRIKSGYQLRSITARTHHANGNDIPDGPMVSSTYPLGYFREDYEFIAHTEAGYLDEHNGRFCVTPDYPQGIYAYFATVDEEWNSAYPYVVGPTFYGVRTASKVQTISEPVTTWSPSSSTTMEGETDLKVGIFPNPSAEFFAVQVRGMLENEVQVQLYSENGALIQEATIQPGSTICYLDARTLYAGAYLVKVSAGGRLISAEKVVVE